MPLTVQPPITALLINGVQRFASCWRVQRRDGVTFRFTDHDLRIQFDDDQEAGPTTGVITVVTPGGGIAGIREFSFDNIASGAKLFAGEQFQFAGHDEVYTVSSCSIANGSDVAVSVKFYPALVAPVAENEVVTRIKSIFFPLGGFNASSRQKMLNLKTRNTDVIGILDDDRITHSDMAAGLYREAEFTEFLIDWKFPKEGFISKTRFWVSSTVWSGEVWNATLEGVARYLQQNVGRVYQRTCPLILGDSKCTVDLTDPAFLFTGTVGLVVGNRLTFRTDLVNDDAFFNYGNLTWTGGANEGTSVEVKQYYQTNGVITLELRTPRDILVGDTFSITAGCDKLHQTCIDKYDNAINFRGYPFIPGTDKVITTPNVK